MLTVKDLSDNFIGTLTISYYEKEYELTSDDWILLRQKTGALGSILSDYLYDKK